jgi:HEAT repeat protein
MDPLLKAMDDTDAQVREKVAIALGASGDPRAMSALERALSDPDAQVREKAASGLILLGLRK